VESAIELDSHADSPVAGSFCHILEKHNRQLYISGFTDDLGKPILVDVINAAVTYDCMMTGNSYIMILRNALHIPSIEVCLLHPIMMRLAGVEVDECPKFLSSKPSIINHSIYFPTKDLRIQLILDGIISCLPCRTPDDEELEQLEILELTPKVNTWNPHSSIYKEQEEAMTDFRGEIKTENKRRFIISKVNTRSDDPTLLLNDIEERFCISSVRCENGQLSKLDPNKLSAMWNIGVDIARKTIQNSTQLCPRNSTEITLNRRYSTNDRMLRYKHLNTNMYSDTMFASKRIGKSIRNFIGS